jgi:hypothetical protein
MVCAPLVVDENVYVADPDESASDEFTVVPSTTIASVPVGVVVTALDADATLMVIVSLAPELGEVVAAESVVVELVSAEAVVLGHTVSRL